MFTAVTVEGYRGFERLTLPGLGRVNLIVGPNNTGKTSLLEALALLGEPSTWPESLKELRRDAGQSWVLRAATGSRVSSLSAEEAGGHQRQVAISECGKPPPHGRTYESSTDLADVTVRYGSTGGPTDACVIASQSPDPAAVVALFADAVRSPESEATMELLLRLVDPRIRSLRIDLTGAQPFIAVDLGLPERLPLSQAGQGMVRLVAILSAVLGARPDVCLIDEIENGLHHSALPAVWTGLAEIAEQLGVQVFATTHSRECLAAAHRAFRERAAYDLRVIQLYLVNGHADGRVLGQEHIESALSADIEVR